MFLKSSPLFLAGLHSDSSPFIKESMSGYKKVQLGTKKPVTLQVKYQSAFSKYASYNVNGLSVGTKYASHQVSSSQRHSSSQRFIHPYRHKICSIRCEMLMSSFQALRNVSSQRMRRTTRKGLQRILMRQGRLCNIYIQQVVMAKFENKKWYFFTNFLIGV